MCQHLTVAENIFLGREKTHAGVLSSKQMNEQAAAVLGRMNIQIDPETVVGDLAVSKQQMVEIAKRFRQRAHPDHGRADFGADVQGDRRLVRHHPQAAR